MSSMKQFFHLYEWNKYYYASSFLFTGIAGCFHYSGFSSIDLITYSLVLFSLLYTFISFQKDYFSLKYLQSLPLSKKELYHLKLGDSLLGSLPLIFWGIVFYPLVWEIISDKKNPDLESILMLVILYFMGAILVAIWSFFRLYESSRSPYVKGNPKTHNYVQLRNSIYYFTVFSYAFYAFILVASLLQSFAPKFLLDMKEAVKQLDSGWTFLYLIALCAWFEYHRVFLRWMDEKRSYIRYNWKPLRDVPLMALAIMAILAPPAYFQSLYEKSHALGRSNLIESVMMKDMGRVKKLLDGGADINRTSSKGHTAIMAAAYSGNAEIYFYLLSRGASKEGIVKTGHSKGEDLFWMAVHGGNELIVKDLVSKSNVNREYSGFFPISLAASRCHPGVIDILLEAGANPKVKSLSKPSLHYAAGRGCLNGVISLIEAGADPLQKDGDGKQALEYAKSRDLKYYLERKSRSPAGK